MVAFSIGSFLFVILAITGLLLFVVGLVFLIKNIKWKKEKEKLGIKATGNIIGIVCFGIMIFFGFIWFICFGAGAIVFGVMGGMF